MRRTTTVVTNTVHFIGHLWSGPLAAGDVEFPKGRQHEWNRAAVLEWLRRGKKFGNALTPSGDFQDIIDFECDFSENSSDDWQSGWREEGSEETFLLCMD
jgi:hypothetical protein